MKVYVVEKAVDYDHPPQTLLMTLDEELADELMEDLKEDPQYDEKYPIYVKWDYELDTQKPKSYVYYIMSSGKTKVGDRWYKQGLFSNRGIQKSFHIEGPDGYPIKEGTSVLEQFDKKFIVITKGLSEEYVKENHEKEVAKELAKRGSEEVYD